MSKQQNRRMYLFLIVVAIEIMAANFAHPITPTLLKNLHMPDYMFGFVYAGMSFTNFLFSPMWATLGKRLGSKKTLLICCCGYGLGQFLFMVFKTPILIMIARMVSGFFVGGIFVSQLTYIIHKADYENRGKFLALNATIQTVFGAFGFMIGGFSGLISTEFTFMLQVVTLVASGILFYFILEEDKEIQTEKFSFSKEANPFRAFFNARKFMNVGFVVLFIVVFLTSLATTTYDQSLNYYLKDVFNFNSSYNGIMKAVVGLISLLANTTISLWIMRHTNVAKSFVVVCMIAALLLFGVYMSVDVIPFAFFNILFFGANAIYIPLIQDLCAKHADEEHSGEVMGFYNSMKSMGMVIGGVYAGAIYTIGPKLSFLSSSVFFGLSACLIFILVTKRILKTKN